MSEINYNTERERFHEVSPSDRPPMIATVYEIEPWVEVRLQRANHTYVSFPEYNHDDRWYIGTGHLSDCRYLDELGLWKPDSPKWFDSPEAACNFYHSTADRRR